MEFGGKEENITLLESVAQIDIYNGHSVVSEWCVKTTWKAVRFIAIDTVMALMKRFSACRPLWQWLHQEGGLADRIHNNRVPAEGARLGLLIRCSGAWNTGGNIPRRPWPRLRGRGICTLFRVCWLGTIPGARTFACEQRGVGAGNCSSGAC